MSANRVKFVLILALAITLIASVWVLLARRGDPVREADMTPPAPASVSSAPTDPIDFEDVPSFKEAKQYARIASNRPLTETEINRVGELAGSGHPLTQIKAMSIAIALNLQSHKALFCEKAVAGLKGTNASARNTCLMVLEKFGGPEHAEFIRPLLQSDIQSDKNSARRVLKKFGIDTP